MTVLVMAWELGKVAGKHTAPIVRSACLCLARAWGRYYLSLHHSLPTAHRSAYSLSRFFAAQVLRTARHAARHSDNVTGVVRK